MAQFRYQAVNRLGQSLKGQIEAVDLNAAVEELRKQGLYPMKVKAGSGGGLLTKEIELGFLAGRKVKLQDFVPFCRQFATLIRAGVSVTRSLEILASQTDHRGLKKALVEVHKEVRQGVSLQEAFANHKAVFPEMFVNMVGAGEYSGQLETMLERMAVYFERQRATQQKLVSALTYPILVFFIAIGVSIFLLTTVVPSFAKTFAEQGVELPLPTRITLGISQFLTDQWYIALGGAAVLAVAVTGTLRTKRGRLLWDKLRLRIPVFGKLYQKGLMARFTRTFSTLEASAVPILDQLELLRKVIGNSLFDRVITEAQQKLRKGERLSDVLDKHLALFPPMVTHMVAIGEETGTQEHLLANLADFYETEVNEMSSRLSSILEPMMIVFLAVIVGLIIISVYLPMFKMMNFTQ